MTTAQDGGKVVSLTTFMCRVSSNLGTSTSGKPQCLSSDCFTFYRTYNEGKGKSVPLQAWSGPEGSRKLRLPVFMTTAQDGGKVVSLMHRPPLPPRKYSWYSFLLEAESTPGPQCDRKDFMSMKNSNDTIWDRTSDLPICSFKVFTSMQYDAQIAVHHRIQPGYFLPGVLCNQFQSSCLEVKWRDRETDRSLPLVKLPISQKECREFGSLFLSSEP